MAKNISKEVKRLKEFAALSFAGMMGQRFAFGLRRWH
jgi:hypothetical protein